MIPGRDAARFERCIAAGGVAVFAADTVYGLACDPNNPDAVARLYELKGRPPAKPSAVMVFSREALPPVGERTRAALAALLPGPVTVLVPNPAGLYPLACADDPGTLGLRMPIVPSLEGVALPVLQSSANLAGGPDARRLDVVPEAICAGADLVLDGGELPGLASTVIDLRRYEDGGADAVKVLRHGALDDEALAAALCHEFHFNPDTYGDMLREDYPGFDAFQDRVAAACGEAAGAILELGTGTGETARRLLARFSGATLLGIDESSEMLAAARVALERDGGRVRLRVARLQEPLADGPFDLVVSALCVHHLDAREKADLFDRVAAVLAPGGRFVLGDVVVPEDPADAKMELTPGFDKPSSVGEQVRWLADAGLAPRVIWVHDDVAIIAADAPLDFGARAVTI
ncbi:MAG: Sua5/YciO/YrdC/YwlC family protein [Solirubrobacteraceae bacterium]